MMQYSIRLDYEDSDLISLGDYPTLEEVTRYIGDVHCPKTIVYLYDEQLDRPVWVGRRGDGHSMSWTRIYADKFYLVEKRPFGQPFTVPLGENTGDYQSKSGNIEDLYLTPDNINHMKQGGALVINGWDEYCFVLWYKDDVMSDKPIRFTLPAGTYTVDVKNDENGFKVRFCNIDSDTVYLQDEDNVLKEVTKTPPVNAKD